MPSSTALPPLRLAVVLLAAGRSRRMGGVDKLLLPLPPGGEPMIRHSVGLYLDLGLPVTLVCGPETAALRAALGGLAGHRALAWAINPAPGEDQGESARLGLASLGLEGLDGVIIALADQPLLTGADMAALIACFAQDGARRIAIPRHQGNRGNPLILPTALAQTLRQAPPALTPRRFIQTHADQILWHDTPSAGFTEDIDTPQDAARLLARDVLSEP